LLLQLQFSFLLFKNYLKINDIYFVEKRVKSSFFFKSSRCMKKVVFILSFVPFILSGQINENFEDGTLKNWIQSTNGSWEADSLNPLSGKYSLHHSRDNPEAGVDMVSFSLKNLRSEMDSIKWSFMVRHGYNPSSSNNWSFFLLADRRISEMLPGTTLNGYAIGVNMSGYDDTLRLWKIKNGNVSPFISTGVNWEKDIGTKKAAITEIVRTLEGDWHISVTLNDGTKFNSCTGTDIEICNPEWCGIYFKYTATCDRLLWFDNLVIEGPFISDTVPPAVSGCEVKGRNIVEISVEEEVLPDFMDKANFLLNNIISPLCDAVVTGRNTFRLIFDEGFINKQINELKINIICDRDSNCTENVLLKFVPVWAETGDVVISEIMADPSPPVALPEKEYIEITSRCEFPLSLKGWSIISGSQKYLFPDITINKGEQYILCHVSDTAVFSKYGKTCGFKSFPALTDAGKCLVICDSSGTMIHGVEYFSSWYGDNLKSEGGWSLEMIDTDYPFYYDGNWKASVSVKGGTPDKPNSVNAANPDRSFEGILNVFPDDSLSLRVLFSEPVYNVEILKEEIRINDRIVDSVKSFEPLRREWVFKVDEYFKRGKSYKLILPAGLTDFAGNRAQRSSMEFGLPETPEAGDIVFNELLFNPLPGDADYIELYNVSGKIIDASKISVASKSFENGKISSALAVSAISRCFLPGMYYVITENKPAVISRYFSSCSDNIFRVSQMPSMPDDKGHLILFNRALEILDEVQYSEKQHLPFLSGREGIALEKINPGALSSLSGNWHTASEASGWGTPGAKNSMFSEITAGEGNISLSSTRLSPNSDGNEDLLLIYFKLPGNGNVTNITIFDETGNSVRKLAVNFFIGNEATVVWDGTSDDGSLVQRGIYIIYISVFDEHGKTERWKKVCTVLR